MSLETVNLLTWIVSGLGIGLMLYGFLERKNPIRRQRLQDCGVTLAFTGVIARVAIGTERSQIDWIFAALGLIFIPLSLWRLSRTQRHAEGKPE